MTSLTFAKSPKSLVKGSRTLLVLAPASAFRKATQRVYRSGAEASAIRFSILPRAVP